MKHADIVALMRAAAPAFRDFVAEALGPLAERIVDLERQVAERDRQIADIRSGIAGEIAEGVKAAVQLIPVPKASVAREEIEPLLLGYVREAVKALPAAKDGVGVAGALIDRAGNLVLTLSNGEQKSLGQVIGKDADAEAIRSAVAIEVAAAYREIAKAREADAEALGREIETKVSDAIKSLAAGIRVPEDGRSVTLKDVEPLISEVVEKAVAALPRPEDGKSVEPAEVDAMVVKAVAAAMKDIVLSSEADGKSEATVSALAEGLQKLISSVEADLPARVDRAVAVAVEDAVKALPKPEPGVPGKSVTPEELRPMVEAEVDRRAAGIPEMVQRAVDGLPKLEDGKSVTIQEVELVLADLVDKAVERLPKPQAVTVDDFAPLIERGVEAAVAEALPDLVRDEVAKIPRPEDGKSITIAEVEPVLQGMVDKAVERIPKPKDGIGLTGGLIDQDGNLVLTATDGSTKMVGRVAGTNGVDVDMERVTSLIKAEVAAIPKPENGKDGLGFEDLTVEQESERRFVIRFNRSDRVKEFGFDIPVMIYRGLFQLGTKYERGDTVTWAGSLWHCEAPTADKPGADNPNWKLAAKRGRDAKEPVKLS